MPNAQAAGAELSSLLFDRVETMVCTLDLDGRFTSVNEAGTRLTGYSPEELRGAFATLVIAPEHREEAVEQFRRRASGEQGDGRDETVLLTRDGKRIPVEVSSTVFSAADGTRGVLGVVVDLSEQREAARALQDAESALLESERRFARSFESAAIGMALVAPDGRFLEVNDSLCELVGYSRDELLERSFQDITHPDDLELDLDNTRRMLAGEIRSYHMEKRYLHRYGGTVWVLLSVSLVTSADGEPVHFVSQIQDITARKRAQQALERSEAQLAEAQQLAHLGSWKLDYASQSISTSREFRRIYGLPPDDEVTRAMLQAQVHPDDVEAVAASTARQPSAGDFAEVQFRIVRPDESIRWIYSRWEQVSEGDAATGSRGFVQDVTDRKEAEQQLADAERRYRSLVEQLPLGVYIRPLDLSQPNIYASPQVEPLLGYPAAEWEKNPGLLASIVHPDDRERVLDAAERVRATGEPSHDEYRYVARDGRTVWVQDETYVVADENGEPAYVQGFLRDITERKRAELERDRLRDELHHAQKLEGLGRLAGGIAHDFNNMLTAIKGYSELLVESLDPGTPAHAEALQIKRAAEQAAELPQQLLAFGRKQTLQPALVDLNDVVVASGRLLRHLLTAKIKLVTDTAAQQPYVNVDPSQLEHVLVNLALNARDAMPDGGTLTLTTRNVDVVEPLAREHDVSPGPYVSVAVTDTGIGMDEATKDRIFEPFFTTKAPGAGSGLGLSRVYGTVTQSGGFLQVTSEPQAGTTIAIHIPRAEVTAPAPRDIAPDELGPSILLVEDEEVVREFAGAVLDRAGYRVHAAADGAEALELYERLGGRVHALVTDLVMPGIGGRELRDRIHARDPRLPVVFMSGYADEPLEPEPGDDVDFLQKPFSPRSLVAAVRKRLDAAGIGDAITCVVADDHPAVLDAVSRYLESKDIRVTKAASGEEALLAIEGLKPAVALVDAAMSPMDGLDVTRRTAVVSPSTRTVVYTGHHDRALLEEALDAGASGLVFKDAPLTELERALRVVAEGGTYVADEITAAISEPREEIPSLTPRELEILGLVADGMTNEKVATSLSISPETVQSHVRNAMVKLGAESRTEAVATALRLSLIA